MAIIKMILCKTPLLQLTCSYFSGAVSSGRVLPLGRKSQERFRRTPDDDTQLITQPQSPRTHNFLVSHKQLCHCVHLMNTFRCGLQSNLLHFRVKD